MKETSERLFLAANVWLLLDNLVNGWSIGHNLLRCEVQPTLAECESRGWVKDGAITAAGRIALLGSTTNQE